MNKNMPFYLNKSCGITLLMYKHIGLLLICSMLVVISSTLSGQMLLIDHLSLTQKAMAQSVRPSNIPSFVKVILRVDNTGGGTAKPSDFDIRVSGDNGPSPDHFSGSQNGTIVAMTGKGSYGVSVEQTSGSLPYGKSYSGNCALNAGYALNAGATIKDGEKQICIITMIFPNF